MYDVYELIWEIQMPKVLTAEEIKQKYKAGVIYKVICPYCGEITKADKDVFPCCGVKNNPEEYGKIKWVKLSVLGFEGLDNEKQQSQ